MRTLLGPIEEQELEGWYLAALAKQLLHYPQVYQWLYQHLDLGTPPPLNRDSAYELAKAIYSLATVDSEMEPVLIGLLDKIYQQEESFPPYMIAATEAGQAELNDLAYHYSQYPNPQLEEELRRYKTPPSWIAINSTQLAYLVARLRLGLIIDPLSANLERSMRQDSTRERRILHELAPHLPVPETLTQLKELLKRIYITIPPYRVPYLARASYFPVIEEYLRPWYEAIRQNPQQVISTLGIVIPANTNPIVYLDQNLSSYLPVISDRYTTEPTMVQLLKDPSILNHYTDSFLLAQFYVPYRSRQQLIQRLESMIHEPNFFISSPCQGVAFGTLFDHDCISIPQLLKGLKRFYVDNQLIIELELPDGHIADFKQLSSLAELASIFPELSELKKELG